ncbi:DUF6461 domain-containing protein [Actinomadura coerulea]|uniref:DUF6461 domain-containing protein n=1 Tax=Actinomadura coerulea TaxID=46159 RepID=UPI00341FDDD0
MTASAADYAWFRDYRRGSLYEMYCMTLVQGPGPAEVLARLGAEPQGELRGFDAFTDRDGEFQDGQDLYGDYMFVGAMSVCGHDGPWTLAVEINGTVGTDDRLMGPLSTGTRVVSHYRNINAVTLFHWWEDGELRTQFEWPVHRSGSSPDALVQTMAEVGFDLVEGSSDVAGNLALAEELTGVRITADLLDTSHYDTGIVEMPTEEWTSVTIDITDADGQRLHKIVTRQEVEQALEERRASHALARSDAAIRTWAQSVGIKVPREGPLPAIAIEQYEASHDTESH